MPALEIGLSKQSWVIGSFLFELKIIELKIIKIIKIIEYDHFNRNAFFNLPGTTLVFLIFFKVVPGTKCWQDPKIRYLDGYKYLKKNFRFLGDCVPVLRRKNDTFRI